MGIDMQCLFTTSCMRLHEHGERGGGEGANVAQCLFLHVDHGLVCCTNVVWAWRVVST